MICRSIYVYPWDLVGRDGVSVCEFQDWVDESHISSISIATSYHAGKFIRPAPKSGPRVVFPEDGTVYFHPKFDQYKLVQPKVSAFTQQVDVLELLCNSGRHPVTGWTVLLHNSRLGFEHLNKVVRNAFGDPYPYSLCPSHPENRHYAVTMCCDLAGSYNLSGLSVETPGFLPFAHGYHHEFSQMSSNIWLDHHLGLCFCDHCMDGAARVGIDAVGLKQTVAEQIDTYLAGSQDLTLAEASIRLRNERVSNSQLNAYIELRCEIVSSLVAEIRAEMRSDCELFVIPTTGRPTSHCWTEGSDLRRLAEIADGIEVPFYEPTVSAILDDAAETRIAAGPNARIRGILRPGQPDLEQVQDLVLAARGLGATQIEGVSFYNFGLLRPHHRRAIAQAARAIKPTTQAGVKK